MRQKNTFPIPAGETAANPLFPLTPKAVRDLLARSATSAGSSD